MVAQEKHCPRQLYASIIYGHFSMPIGRKVFLCEGYGFLFPVPVAIS